MFVVTHRQGAARRGLLQTPHGPVETPVFMNVATQAAIKGGLSGDDLRQIGCQVTLCNTYHLHLRPGEHVVRELGHLHGFMGWDGPMLTDSGGFQVFSLSALRKIEEAGVTFSSHVDGRRVFMGPEQSMGIQADLGADIVMAFDECAPALSEYSYMKDSCDRTLRWLGRCAAELDRLRETGRSQDQMLFGINQGGIFDELRVEHMKSIAELHLPGYAIGGLAVGETAEQMYHVIEAVEPHMPQEAPRYLMGVGTPVNILEAVWRGIDFFDCVMPARNARHAHLNTWSGRLNLKNEKYMKDERPIDEGCGCPVCKRYSRAYIRHLFKAGEILALRLSVMHNLYFYNNLMEKIRLAIQEGTFERFYRAYVPVLDRRI